jgi:ElaB/YqjD/DUF883 family membrane-anchored ribosome-binding protein
MTRMAGRRKTTRSAQRATRAGRARVARSSKTSGARRLIAEARDMAQSVGSTTLHAAAGVANRTQETASAVAEQVWDNKWPALLIGAGATWLIVDAVRGQSDGARSRSRAASRRGSPNFAKQALSTVAGAGRAVGERVGGFVRENPVLAGATTLGVGLAVGMALPATATEDTLLGDARDAVVERAKDAARGTVRNVRNAAQRVAGGSR